MLFSNEQNQPGDVQVRAEISRTPGVAVERSTNDGSGGGQTGTTEGESGQTVDSFSHSHSNLDGTGTLADHTHP